MIISSKDDGTTYVMLKYGSITGITGAGVIRVSILQAGFIKKNPTEKCIAFWCNTNLLCHLCTNHILFGSVSFFVIRPESQGIDINKLKTQTKRHYARKKVHYKIVILEQEEQDG